MQDARCKMQDARCKMQDARCKMQDARCKMQDARCKMQDARCKMQDATLLLHRSGRVSTGINGRARRRIVRITPSPQTCRFYLFC